MTAENPYAPPTEPQQVPGGSAAPSEASAESLPVEPAPHWKRLVNLIVDSAASIVLLNVFWLAVLLVMYLVRGEEATRRFGESILLQFCFVVTLALIYFVQEAAFGRTLGKLLTGTIVVKESALPVSVSEAFGRSLCRLLPFEPISGLFGRKCIPWHDQFTKTRVVSTRPARRNE